MFNLSLDEIIEKDKSMYQIFHEAGKSWSINEYVVERHFSTYLMDAHVEDRLPHYVRDYCRKNLMSR